MLVVIFTGYNDSSNPPQYDGLTVWFNINNTAQTVFQKKKRLRLDLYSKKFHVLQANSEHTWMGLFPSCGHFIPFLCLDNCVFFLPHSSALWKKIAVKNAAKMLQTPRQPWKPDCFNHSSDVYNGSHLHTIINKPSFYFLRCHVSSPV